MLKTDKELKKEFKIVASEKPEDYYATDVLKEEGFMRKSCEKCNTFFWTINKDQIICGDPACQGGVKIVDGTPAKNKLTFTETWKLFEDMFTKKGYKSVARYPVIARWNPTTEFTNASIAAFQPFVISGEVEPPAKKLVIPQFSLRFVDVDNVGITGSHMTGFVMIGQHMFVSPEEWDQNKVFRDIYEFIIDGVGLEKSELTMHEDAWAGGGNFGPCMEFFSKGIELFNQVYMMFEQLPDASTKKLDLKVLDMGMGMERVAWFSQGVPNIYEATFPEIITKLKNATKVEYDAKLFSEFSLHSALLNVDEVEDMKTAWEDVAKKVGELTGVELKKKILPMTAIYSIAEHARALLFAIVDGGLPSNVGGGYNLRVILRRALTFIDQFNWNINFIDVCKWHAQDLKELFPELLENIDQVENIITVETEKFKTTRQKAQQIIERLLKKGDITTQDLLELYDSQGISPEIVKKEAQKLGKSISIPDDFYKKVAALHEKKEQVSATRKLHEIEIPPDIPKTNAKYFDDYKELKFKSKIIKIIEQNNKTHIILDDTYFYPTSGGQLCDKGTIGSAKVINVFKQGNHIVHVLENIQDKKVCLKETDSVECEIEFDRRKILTQHHTATHVINGVCRRILGNHIWQAGAAKSLTKARLDITHYESLNQSQLEQIEEEANKIVQEDLPVYKKFLPRNLAEAEYGFRLYQGGAVPGREIRIVEIPGLDVEACGGTHLDLTGEIEQIKILRSTKVQDGIVRIEFAVGAAASKVEDSIDDVLSEISKILNVKSTQIPGRVNELFSKWKIVRKAIKKKKSIDITQLNLSSTEEFDGEYQDILKNICATLKTQPEVVINTINRFLKELEELKKKLTKPNK
ncbi:alanine--tRNA ligase [Candidatus Woesearchaeota archaeon]|jgi:alanyl-tRNA synthetase|nr:alanine--tRNA ligase [Candidatus Woesearchaeota archaeon]MBT6519556.1 alanine--tRNA ligase [Candidatus Woesearchaeota archaeon]MBT7367699.1 alanine--tRNA ligase [Candidatus Woesearchaeota archaeon]